MGNRTWSDGKEEEDSSTGNGVGNGVGKEGMDGGKKKVW